MCIVSRSSFEVVSVALLVVHQANNRKVVGSMPTNVVCITVLTASHLGYSKLSAVAGHHSFFRAVSLRLSAFDGL